MAGKIPIKAAERLAEQYECPIVVIYAIHDKGEQFCVTTYGQSKALCRHAADLGKKLAEAILGGEVVPAQEEPPGLPDAPAVWESVNQGLAALRADIIRLRGQRDALLAACEMLIDDPGITAGANEVLRGAVALARATAEGR